MIGENTNNKRDNLKQVAKEIFIKTNKQEYVEYIISELETEENAAIILKYINDNPNWSEREMTRKALFVAGVLKNDYT